MTEHLYVDPASSAIRAATTATAEEKQALLTLARYPVGRWLGEWDKDVEAAVRKAVNVDGLRVLVPYFLPKRDCGSFSAGGARTATAYREFVAAVARGLSGEKALVILEPDGLALVHCLKPKELAERHALLADAVQVLTKAGAEVYLDAGKDDWHPAKEMAAALKAAGVENAAGFSLDVSHYGWVSNQVVFAQKLRNLVGTQAKYLVDTGRSGRGDAPGSIWGDWLGFGVGERPTLDTGIEGCRGFVWAKPPWAADSSTENAGKVGAVAGSAPGAGKFWGKAAIAGVKHASPRFG